MAGEKPALRITLHVDKKKEKVVLAEVGKDFVDVLFSFLTFPIGTIVRLLEKYHQGNQNSPSVAIGCFNNVYKSVCDLHIDHFFTEACKHILVYPRSLREMQYSRLKVNIDDTEIPKYFKCPNFGNSEACSNAYSNFCSSRCYCGELMTEEIEEDACHIFIENSDGHGVHSIDDVQEIFVSEKTSFIITDNMEVGFASIAFTLKSLKELGYTDLDKVEMEEMSVDVNHKEVLALFYSLFASETPLTDIFLKKQSSYRMKNRPHMPSLDLKNGAKSRHNESVSLTVFVRILDMEILYAESDHKFVDVLFNSLAVPLLTIWEISGRNTELGCIDNFCESMNGMNYNFVSTLFPYGCVLPWYYYWQRPLLDTYCRDFVLLKWPTESACYFLRPMYPSEDRSRESATWCGHGLVKKGRSYMISDDLTITATNSSSTTRIMKKWNVNLDDLEEHVINITRAEYIILLRASFCTSNALTIALKSLIPEKPKKEEL